ncbi:MAG: PhoU domain-containing protein [Candidatus Omnitrophica bacterium]|nr:PhoU domain-containing protein [Candidatus Omnitrophota bacterium]
MRHEYFSLANANHFMDMRNISIDIEKELRKLNDELLKGCRLTQEAISKTSSVLACFDAQKIQEITDNNKKIGVHCVAFGEHFSGIIEQHKPEGVVLKLLSSGISIYVELKEISDLTIGIAKSLSNLDMGIPERYKINASQFAKIFQNITWDSVISFLKQDTELARKTILASLELKKICNRAREDLLGADRISESVTKSNSDLLFIIQCIEDIAVHTVNIAEHVACL